MLNLLKTISAGLLLLLPAAAWAQDTNFTYQGSLLQSGSPAQGLFDFEFAVFDTPTGGAPLTLETFLTDVSVDQGIFTIDLDISAAVFNNGPLYLQIQVRPAATGPLTLLSPRQELKQTPRAALAHVVGPGGVNNASLSNNSVTASKIADNAVVSSKIASNAVGASEMANNAVGSAEIINNSINAIDINTSQVQHRVTSACSSGSSIRVINESGGVICQTDGGLSNGNPSNVYGDLVENGGVINRTMEPVATHACFLSLVRFRDVDGSTEEALCRVTNDGVNWILQTRTTTGNDADAECEGTCFSLSN
ncbi:MAG: hypothetical protein Tsb002_33910 [Wenzhouxiangellaceae bacterium]